ncbi:hypothetical protein [Brevundimonas sp.]|uniref:hypothetical protein n=1 Tax=Brevundimonas sp. TaxID=1871086 RepID=UPI003D0FA9A9
MIRYPYDATEVEKAIARLDRRWKAKAAERTEKLIKKARYAERSAIWSTVKPVFMKLQHEKCIFCEQRFEGGLYGPVAWDLEHFRPKSNVAIWPDPGRHPELAYEVDLGQASDAGYYWLAYELQNYAASCKVCNTIFKLNFFPVTQPRAQATATADLLAAEEALLCYPLGDTDEDPEDLVTFILTTAVPRHNSGAKALRGQVIIDFLGLNKRDGIHVIRAQMIAAAGNLLAERDRGGASQAVLDGIEELKEANVPHASCVRAFLGLWDSDRATATRGYELCRFFGFDPTKAPPSL